MSLQDEKERLKGQVAAANQGTTANSAQLQDKHTFIASLQVCSDLTLALCSVKAFVPELLLLIVHKLAN